MNSERHYLVVISVAKCSDRHYILPQISLPSSDVHYSFFTVRVLLDSTSFPSVLSREFSDIVIEQMIDTMKNLYRKNMTYIMIQS